MGLKVSPFLFALSNVVNMQPFISQNPLGTQWGWGDSFFMSFALDLAPPPPTTFIVSFIISPLAGHKMLYGISCH